MEIHLDGGGADAALAKLALLGGLEGFNSRIAPTLDLIAERLGRGGLIDRHRAAGGHALRSLRAVRLSHLLAGRSPRSRRARRLRMARVRPLPPGGRSIFSVRSPIPIDHTPLGNYPAGPEPRLVRPRGRRPGAQLLDHAQDDGSAATSGMWTPTAMPPGTTATHSISVRSGLSSGRSQRGDPGRARRRSARRSRNRQTPGRPSMPMSTSGTCAAITGPVRSRASG